MNDAQTPPTGAEINQLPGRNLIDFTPFQGVRVADHTMGDIPPGPANLGVIPPTYSRFPAARELAYFRALFPFVDIMPLPVLSRTVTFSDPFTAVDIALPNETVLCEFAATGDFYMSTLGRAALPSVEAINSASAMDRPNSILNPVGRVWYVKGISTISVISGLADVSVNIRAWSQVSP